jgi:hypothetical protein
VCSLKGRMSDGEDDLWINIPAEDCECESARVVSLLAGNCVAVRGAGPIASGMCVRMRG